MLTIEQIKNMNTTNCVRLIRRKTSRGEYHYLVENVQTLQQVWISLGQLGFSKYYITNPSKAASNEACYNFINKHNANIGATVVLMQYDTTKHDYMTTFTYVQQDNRGYFDRSTQTGTCSLTELLNNKYIYNLEDVINYISSKSINCTLGSTDLIKSVKLVLGFDYYSGNSSSSSSNMISSFFSKSKFVGGDGSEYGSVKYYHILNVYVSFNKDFSLVQVNCVQVLDYCDGDGDCEDATGSRKLSEDTTKKTFGVTDFIDYLRQLCQMYL